MKLSLNQKIGVKEADFLIELHNLMEKHSATFDVSIHWTDYECCHVDFTYDIDDSSTGNTLLLGITGTGEVDNKSIYKILHSSDKET